MQISVVLVRFGNFIKLGGNHKVHAKLQQCNALIDYCCKACLCCSTNVLSICFFRATCFSFRFGLMRNGGALFLWGSREAQPAKQPSYPDIKHRIDCPLVRPALSCGYTKPGYTYKKYMEPSKL